LAAQGFATLRVYLMFSTYYQLEMLFLNMVCLTVALARGEMNIRHLINIPSAVCTPLSWGEGVELEIVICYHPTLNVKRLIHV
jgi:hypothetical protein